MKHVAIVGGGIAGLSAAFYLRRLVPDVAITLVERDARLGGKLVTTREAGFVVEGAPDCFLSRKAPAIALCEALGITAHLQGRDPAHARTFVRRRGELHPLPEGLTGMVPTRLDALAGSRLVSPEGRARLAQEPTLPPAPASLGDESVAAFMSRRVGSEVFENLIEPLMGGIYAGDAGQLSLAATFPQLRQLELAHGSLLGGLAATPPAVPAPYPPFVSFRSGMAKLVETLVAHLERVTLRLGTGAERIEADGRGYTLALEDGSCLHAAALVLATPAFVTARLVEGRDEALAAAHRAIPYGSSVTLSLAYAQADLPIELDGYGYVIPSIEGGAVTACTWSSSKWAGRAPEGFALVRLYLGRYGGPDVLAESDETLRRLAQDELARTLGIRAAPQRYWLFRWPRSMPQYTLGHLERVARIEARLCAHPGLFVAGAAYRGVGIPDCIASGEAAARGVAAYVTHGT